MNTLKELRTSRKIAQQEIADYLGVSRQCYSNYETGKREPDFETLLKLGEYFEVSVDYLLRGSVEEPAETSEPTDDDIKFALFNGSEGITDEMFAEVKQFAEMVKLREETKRKK